MDEAATSMSSEIYFSEGDRHKPLVIFIHGMGMKADMWAEPEHARILGGRYPLSILLADVEMRTSFDDLKGLGFPVLAWSQRRPAGPAEAAVTELKELADRYYLKSDAGIILIGHSRGGLIARRFLADCDSVRAVITIGAPHKGSTVAKWVVHASPLSSALMKIMGDMEVKGTIHRVVAFLSGKGIREMLPGSEFLRGLSTGHAPDVRIASIGGTDPALVKIGKTSLPALLSGIMREGSLPDEMTEGKGDGFVSAESSVYPGGDEHRNFHDHHAALLFCREVREYIKQIVTSLER